MSATAEAQRQADEREQKRIAENAAWIVSLKRLPEMGNYPGMIKESTDAKE